MTLSLAKALKALKKGAEALNKWDERNDQVDNIRFEYESKLGQDRPLFKVKLTSDQPRVTILKISRTYNIEMHQ